MERLLVYSLYCCMFLCLRPSDIYANKTLKLGCESALSYGNNILHTARNNMKRRRRRRAKRNRQEIAQLKEQIVSLMDKNRKITKVILADKLDESEATIAKMMQALNRERRIKRFGSRKSGSWKVFKKGEKSFVYDFQEEQDKAVVLLMIQNPRISLLDLTHKMGVSKTTISRITARLRKKGWMKRKSSRFENWEVFYDPIQRQKTTTAVLYDSTKEQKTIQALILNHPLIINPTPHQITVTEPQPFE